VEKRIRVAVITVSTRSSAGEREDTSGPAIRDLVHKTIGETVYHSVVTDDIKILSEELIRICDELRPDVLFTLGGTGLAPSDVTPEATESVIERKVPGISEALRMRSLQITDRAMLSRGISGVRKNTLIVNMPGSERAARESFDIVQPVLRHAVDLIQNTVKDCGRPVREG
jgi:molybdenum cofactor synthesis domain-containing protein